MSLQVYLFNCSFLVFLFLTETIFIQFPDKLLKTQPLQHQNGSSFTSAEKTQAKDKALQAKGLL